MNIEGNFIQEASARLIANAFEYVLVKWRNSTSVEVVSSNLIQPWFEKDTIEINDVCSYKDATKLKNHFKDITQQPSTLPFTMKIGSRLLDIYCSSQRINGDKLSLWVELPDSNNSMQYLHNAVHDMKSPINSILGVVNLMQHSLNEEPNVEELKMFLDLIKTTAHNSVKLVNEVMELAEIESPDYKLETEELSINEFIKQYINTHRLLTIKKKISIHFDNNEKHLAALNKVKMTRVFDNVISNAVKFSQPGSNIYINSEFKNGQVTVAVKDEGIGMPKAVLGDLFVKFGNAKRKGLEGENSSGLGLSIVKQIMELHGGTVNVDSEENKGTTVFLTLKRIKE